MEKWHFPSRIFGGGREPDPVVTVGQQPTEAVLGYTLLLDRYLDRYRDLGGTLEFVDAVEEQLPNIHLILAPVEEEGAPYFRLMAGPATTADEAEALRARIARVLTREDPTTWVVLETPYAYFAGETETFGDAQARLDALFAMGVPAYALRVTFPDGSRAYRLYVGAYGSPEEAMTLRAKDILEDNGLDDPPLVERRGRLPE